MSSSTFSYPTSEYFDLHQLAGKVFAAIATPQGAAYSNAGIIDLGFFSTLPFLPYSQPEAWITHLESFEQADCGTFVPGPGKLGTKDDLALQRSYYEVLEDLVSAVVTSG